MNTITVVFTCFNRKQKTIQCIESLSSQNPQSKFSYVIFDDGSTDGTYESLQRMEQENHYPMKVLRGDGTNYWAGGMRKAIAYAKESTSTDFYLLVNDDVCFYENAIDHLVEQNRENQVLVGPTCDDKGNYSYGGIRYTRGVHYVKVALGEECDSFNMNCLLIPQKIFMDTPNFDPQYVHGLADFDYGLTMKKQGIIIRVGDSYIGSCENNKVKGSWNDCSLSRRQRLRLKENPKGAPWKPWFYFLKKNFGMKQAIKSSLTPYIRILLGK